MGHSFSLLRFVCVLFVLAACASEPSDSTSGRRGDGGTQDEMPSSGGRDEDDIVTLIDAGVSQPDAGGNGDVCTDNEDCISGDCSASIEGTKYCYGTAELGEQCAITQDCATGLCAGAVCTDPATLLPNGATCSDGAECASLECGMSVGGDTFCFGSIEDGDACAITQDCATGVCRLGICADASACAIGAECAVNSLCSQGVCTQACGFNAVAVDGSCSCLPGFDWASTEPDDTNCVKPTVLPGCHLFAQNSEESYLGSIGDCTATGSVCNPDSTYGNELSDTSIFNAYGTFGSELGAYSAFNANTSTPPLLICDGAISGCVTKSEDGCTGSTVMDPSTLCDCQ